MALLGSQVAPQSIPDPSVVLRSPGRSSRVGVAQRGFGGDEEGLLSPLSRAGAAAEVPSLADSRKLQQKGEFTAQCTEGNYEFLNLFWMDSTILLLASLKLFSFQLLFVLTPSRLQHKTQDPDKSWHL